MKSIFLYLVFVLMSMLTVATVKACDICGCGVGSYYIGILPEFRKQFIGFRYQHKGLRNHISPGGGTSYLTTDEHYRTLELWGAWNIGKRFRLLGFLPYNFLERTNQGISTSLSGLGDIAINGYYRILDKNSMVGKEKLMVQSLWLGMGIKAPTGKYNSEEKNIAAGTQNSFQLGTGSWDLMLNAMYDIRLMDWGLNLNTGYKINTENSDGYRYGNKLTLNGLLYHKFRAGKNMTLAPNAGAMGEWSAKDAKLGSGEVYYSGGSTIMGTLGVEWNTKHFSIGGNYQSPLQQNLAAGTVKAKDRFMVSVTYSF